MRPIAKCNRAPQRKYIPLYGDMCVHLHSQKYPLTKRHFFWAISPLVRGYNDNATWRQPPLCRHVFNVVAWQNAAALISQNRRVIIGAWKDVCCTTVFFFCRRAADKLLYYPNSRVDTGSFQAAESSLRFATAWKQIDTAIAAEMT